MICEKAEPSKWLARQTVASRSESQIQEAPSRIKKSHFHLEETLIDIGETARDTQEYLLFGTKAVTQMLVSRDPFDDPFDVGSNPLSAIRF